MELTPQDIGNERYLKLMRRRMSFGVHNNSNAHTSTVSDESPLPIKVRRRTQRLRRYWVRDLKLDDATGDALSQIAWKGSPAAGPRIAFIILSTYIFMGTMIGAATNGGMPPQAFAAILLAWAAMAYGLAVAPRPALRKLHQKTITSGEIDRLIPAARGRLERSYLNLVHDAIHLDIPSATAQADIRSALRDLGDTISRLPAEALPAHDPAMLRAEAEASRAKAQLEPDSFVQSSLLRQAAALEHRASLAHQSVTSARRLTALRREARSQMDALRAVLLAFEQTSQADSVSIGHLSEAVQRVAQEAQAASVARRELEEDEISQLLGAPLPANLPPQPILPARKVIDPISPKTQPSPQPNPAAQEPAVQVLQAGRPWWRGQ